MPRTPMSLEKMTCDAATGTVIYRPKMHLGLKRNSQAMPGAECLALLCKHTPDKAAPAARNQPYGRDSSVNGTFRSWLSC